MDVYHVWASLKTSTRDAEFSDSVHGYLGHLQEDGRIAGYRLAWRKLGLGHPNLPEWHITIDFDSMAQMDTAFGEVSRRVDPVEGLHQAVNSKVEEIFFALYRDFPDDQRVRGEEKF